MNYELLLLREFCPDYDTSERGPSNLWQRRESPERESQYWESPEDKCRLLEAPRRMRRTEQHLKEVHQTFADRNRDALSMNSVNSSSCRKVPHNGLSRISSATRVLNLQSLDFPLFCPRIF